MQRFRHKPTLNGFHVAHVCGQLYYDLRDGVTGNLIGEASGDLVNFRPDGWPLPFGAYPGAIMLPKSRLTPWDGVPIVGHVVDGVGKRIPDDDVHCVVSMYLGSVEA
jgi:capsular polysaccharide biosynthesis protein